MKYLIFVFLFNLLFSVSVFAKNKIFVEVPSNNEKLYYLVDDDFSYKIEKNESGFYVLVIYLKNRYDVEHLKNLEPSKKKYYSEAFKVRIHFSKKYRPSSDIDGFLGGIYTREFESINIHRQLDELKEQLESNDVVIYLASKGEAIDYRSLGFHHDYYAFGKGCGAHLKSRPSISCPSRVGTYNHPTLWLRINGYDDTLDEKRAELINILDEEAGTTPPPLWEEVIQSILGWR